MQLSPLQQAVQNGAEDGRRKALGMPAETPGQRRVRQAVELGMAKVRATFPPMLLQEHQVKGHKLYLDDSED